jgi:serine/threonine protein kinase
VRRGPRALRLGSAQDAAFYERFRHDLGIVARLEHPAIVTVHHGGQANERAFVVMQLMEGGSLRGRLEHGPVSMKETVE